jgi:cytoskeletal protein RodZ
VSDAAPLPPPPPPPTASGAHEPDERGRNTLAALAILGLVLALVFGLLWLGVRGSRDDAANERDIALAERDDANENAIALSNELEGTKDQLADAQSDVSAADPSEAGDLQADVDRLTAEVERLTAENEALSTAAGSATTTQPAPAPESTQPAPTVAPTTASPTGTDGPSADDIGAWLSSLYRTSVLGEVQRLCLGQTVLDDLGADEVIEILSSGDDAGSNEVLITSIETAAEECGIDPSAVFG